MIARVSALIFVALSLVVAGCGPKEITNADDEALRKQYGREAYEKAMIDAGRKAELDKQKAEEAVQDQQRER